MQHMSMDGRHLGSSPNNVILIVQVVTHVATNTAESFQDAPAPTICLELGHSIMTSLDLDLLVRL